MYWFLVGWVAVWSCPGGLLGKVIPASDKPIVCQAAAYAHEEFASRDDARKKVQELGPSVLPGITQFGPDLKMTELPVTWTPTATF